MNIYIYIYIYTVSGDNSAGFALDGRDIFVCMFVCLYVCIYIYIYIYIIYIDMNIYNIYIYIYIYILYLETIVPDGRHRGRHVS